MVERLTHALAVTLLVLLLVIVVAPLIVVVTGSAVDTSLLGLTSESWQQDANVWSWFSYVLDLYGEHLARSAGLALGVVAAAFVIGFPAAYGLARRNDGWSAAVRVLLDAPLAIPGLTVAIGLLLAYPWARA